MKKFARKYTIFCLSAFFATSCSTMLGTDQEVLMIDDRHPITVDQQTVTMTLEIDPTVQELSSIDKARIRAFAINYNSKGHGPITVTAPSGTRMTDLFGQEMAADVRAVLNKEGVGYDVMKGATYRASGTSEVNNIILSYVGYVATSSDCDRWQDSFASRQSNLNSPNFGCAMQNNLAAMVADPRDLVTSTTLGSTNAERAVVTVQEYITEQGE